LRSRRYVGGAGAQSAPAPGGPARGASTIRVLLGLLVICGLVTAIGVGATGAAARPAAKSQPCPASPSGWKADPANPLIFGPAQQPGQHHTMVSCTYTKGKLATVSVVAEYANTDDQNPNSDFYFGCKTKRSQAWDTTHRTYFVSNPKAWSYVEFADPGHQLPGAAVPAFELVAKALLTNVAPLAHGCKVNTTTPTVMPHLYLFGFEFFASSTDLKAFGGVPASSASNPLVPAGSFSSESTADSTVTSKIVSAHAPAFTIKVVDHGKTYNLLTRITGGSTFTQQPPIQRFGLKLRIVKSTYSRCRTGSEGNVTVVRSQYLNSPTAPAQIRVHLCGAVFGHSKYRGTALLISG
jgi:hypothetical protein